MLIPPKCLCRLDAAVMEPLVFVMKFMSIRVVLMVATARGVAGNSYFGLAIGFTVLAGAYAVGPITGGAFNPAVSLATLMFGVIAAGDIWVYLVPQLLAGAAAALVFNGLDLGDDKATTATPAEQASLRPQAEPAP